MPFHETWIQCFPHTHALIIRLWAAVTGILVGVCNRVRRRKVRISKKQLELAIILILLARPGLVKLDVASCVAMGVLLAVSCWWIITALQLLRLLLFLYCTTHKSVCQFSTDDFLPEYNRQDGSEFVKFTDYTASQSLLIVIFTLIESVLNLTNEWQRAHVGHSLTGLQGKTKYTKPAECLNSSGKLIHRLTASNSLTQTEIHRLIWLMFKVRSPYLVLSCNSVNNYFVAVMVPVIFEAGLGWTIFELDL